MKLPKSWPVEIKRGNATVKIYRTTTRGNPEFKVSYYGSDGERRLKTFADYAEAETAAKEAAAAITRGDARTLTLTETDRLLYLRAVEYLRPTGVALDMAAQAFAEAHQKLNGHSLAEAVNFFVRRNRVVLPDKSVPEVYNELLEVKKADGMSAVYLKDLKFRLGRFSDDFHIQISAVDEPQVNEWLRGLKCGPRGRNNYRLAIGTLFKFAESAGYLSEGHLNFGKIAKAQEADSTIEIFTAAEITKLLNAARINVADLRPGYNLRYATGPGLLPLLALGAFAGLRTAEIERQLWEDILFDRGFIRVTAAKGNTAKKRLVPISENLKQWLAIHKKESGPVCEIARTADAMRRLAKRAKIKWKHNALRHSYISYRVAETQDVAKVSLEAGNSPKMIFNHYRELVTPDEAKGWFAIRPEPVPH